MRKESIARTIALGMLLALCVVALPQTALAKEVTSTGDWGGATYTVYDDNTATVTGKFTSASPGTAPGALQSCTSMDVSGVDTSSVTSMYFMFADCTHLVSIEGLANWDTSEVTDMGGMFYECYSIVNLDDIGGWDVSNVQYMDAMFDSCSSMASVSLAGWDVSGLKLGPGSEHSYYVGSMFFGCDSLESIYIGPKITSEYFVLVGELGKARQGSGWRLEDGSRGPYTAAQLRDAWKLRSMPGHWVNPMPHRVSFDSNGGVGSMVSVEADPSVIAPVSGFRRFGYYFVGWNTMSDGTGRSLVVGATFTPTKDTTLYAQWREMPTTVGYAGGMDIALHSGEQVTINNLLAGCTYEVTETPVSSGWTLVRSQDTTGVIYPHV